MKEKLRTGSVGKEGGEVLVLYDPTGEGIITGGDRDFEEQSGTGVTSVKGGIVKVRKVD